MNNDLKKWIYIIKTGHTDDIKFAKKQIENIWHDTCKYPDKKEATFYIFLEELKTFSQIKDINHQAYFIQTLKWPIYFLGERYFSDWADFILTNIQHPSGKIRQAVVKISTYLLMDLCLDIKFDFDDLKNKDLKSEDIGAIVENNKKKFGNFVMSIEDLLRKYHEPRFNRYKYIQSLPVGIYKSLELLFNELIRSDFYNNIYQEFLNKFSDNQMTHTVNEDILNKRQDIEKRFSVLIKDISSNLSFEDIKNIIYNESGREDLQKIINSFSSVEDFNQLQELISLTMEAWNYFPHKRLSNLSPMEKVQ